MRKLFLFFGLFILILSCTKEIESPISIIANEPAWKQQFPTGREVTIAWQPAMGNIVYGIATFKDNGETRKVTATVDKNGKFVFDNKGDLQLICHCEGCNNGFAPNMNLQWGCDIPCPNCSATCLSPNCQIGSFDTDGWCEYIWV